MKGQSIYRKINLALNSVKMVLFMEQFGHEVTSRWFSILSKHFSKIIGWSILFLPIFRCGFRHCSSFPDYFLFVEVDLAFDEGLLSIHDVQVNHQGELQSQYEGNAILEFLVQWLVMPRFHPYPGAHAAAYRGQHQECWLWDAPFVFLRLPLVNAINQESYHINCGEVVKWELV